MVGQISVFPDVGGAFFGSYRQARSQRLQEAAMRAEMAAAQADRQRQSQARDAFARLQGPDQRTETVTDSTSFGPSLIGYSQNRVTRQGLTPEQRTREEQRLAQADPDGFMAYNERRNARPDLSAYSHIFEALPLQLEDAETDEERQQIVARASRVVNSNGQILSPQQIVETAYAGYAPQEPEATSGIREYEYARSQGYQGTYQQYRAELAAAGRSRGPNITIQPSEGPDLAGLLRETDVSGYRREVLEGAQTQMSTAQNVLDTVADLNSQIELAGGSTQGALGWARRVTSGAQGQIEQLAEYSPALAGMAQSAARDAVGQEDFDTEQWFNDELGGADYLFHTLAYMVAKMRDDSGRVSDADMRNAISSLGGGIFGNDEQLASALRIVQSQAERRYNRALATERRVMSGQDIPDRATEGQEDTPIEDILNIYAPVEQ